MDKIYQRTTWENSPSTNTPINETNLNNIEEGVDELDNRIVELSNIKSNVDWVQLQQSGKKIAEVTIDGVKKNVYAPQSEGGGGGTSDYTDLSNKPKINGVELNGNKTTSDLKINIPTALKDLADDSTHRLVTDAEKEEWNKPSGSDVEVEAILTSGTNIANITVDGNQVKLYAPTGGGGGGTDNYQLLENKPQINGVELNGNKTASDLGIIVPDVPSWALEPNKPSYTASEVGALPDTTTHLSGDVPTTRKVNGKALSSDITLNASDVNALPSTTTIPSALADLTEDATHRTVTDAEKAKWNQGGGGSSVNVIDNLDSTSSTDALSANMGHSLNESLTQKQDSEDDALTTDSKTIVGGINELKQNLNNIGDAWTSRTYNVGEYAIYNNKMWKCLVSNNVTPNESENWTQVTIAEELGGVRLGFDADGNYGYYKVGADTLTPFKSGGGENLKCITKGYSVPSGNYPGRSERYSSEVDLNENVAMVFFATGGSAANPNAASPSTVTLSVQGLNEDGGWETLVSSSFTRGYRGSIGLSSANCGQFLNYKKYTKTRFSYYSTDNETTASGSCTAYYIVVE